MILYTINEWDEIYENHKSRLYDQLAWCALPNKQDGLGYGRLIRMPNGPALYGAFVAICLTASKQKRPRRGHLTDTGRADGRPLTASDLSIKTQLPTELIQAMLDAVSGSEGIDWISAKEVPWPRPPGAKEVPDKCPRHGREPDDEEKRKKEENEEKEIYGVLTPLAFRINSWFHRRNTTVWSDKELKALKAVADLDTAPEEIDILERYYLAQIPDEKNYRRRDIITLLNNWNGEIDRAHRFEKSNQPATHDEDRW